MMVIGLYLDITNAGYMPDKIPINNPMVPKINPYSIQLLVCHVIDISKLLLIYGNNPGISMRDRITDDKTIRIGSDKYRITSDFLLDPSVFRSPVSLARETDLATDILVKLKAARKVSNIPIEPKIKI